jgi:hypothetical protein
MVKRRAKLFTLIALLVSFAISTVALEFVHRHVWDHPQSDETGVSKNSKQMEQGNRACTICLLARHRISSPAIESFRLIPSCACCQLPLSISTHSARDYFACTSCRAPPNFRI